MSTPRGFPERGPPGEYSEGFPKGYAYVDPPRGVPQGGYPPWVPRGGSIERVPKMCPRGRSQTRPPRLLEGVPRGRSNDVVPGGGSPEVYPGGGPSRVSRVWGVRVWSLEVVSPCFPKGVGPMFFPRGSTRLWAPELYAVGGPPRVRARGSLRLVPSDGSQRWFPRLIECGHTERSYEGGPDRWVPRSGSPEVCPPRGVNRGVTVVFRTSWFPRDCSNEVRRGRFPEVGLPKWVLRGCSLKMIPRGGTPVVLDVGPPVPPWINPRGEPRGLSEVGPARVPARWVPE
jgi:hypothetical protein